MYAVRIRIVALTVLLLPAAAGSGEAPAGSTSSPDAAIAGLAPGERVRVRMTSYVSLRGRFSRATTDSMYVTVTAPGVEPRDGVRPRAISLEAVDGIWTVGPHGVGRGLLWAGGTLAIIAALALGTSGGEGDLYFLSGAAIVGVPLAFFMGIGGEKETRIYSRR